MKLDIIIAGVGGQGNLLASVALANYAMNKGLEVFGTETIGAAQRGGSVISHMRISDKKIYSPLVPQGSADILLGFEPVEAVRNIHFLSPKGKFIINNYPIPTVLCNMGMDQYPSEEEILNILRSRSPQGYVIDASEKAKEMGTLMMTNVIMLGALTGIEPFFDKQEMQIIIAELLPQKVLKNNLLAYEEGYKMITDSNAGLVTA
ncbi:MAG: indolepyruvate ferredoxin oxidoreductase, beta subunit [Clostridia bacterium]|jgi:indolepyruvate ferredoxin oxidoreductase beta subunit|nr:indolepyruvate ferredoxin oxidoreductase, beta subunit [Clostridia bacterium]MDN5323535.1 indolepyruvate ferredoxin oxidoreductase, beta subunit [Clostridia bacterium]